MEEINVRKEDQLRREKDKNFTCELCGRIILPQDTLMKDEKPQCLWECLPYINNHQGWLLKVLDRRQE
jgi:hypothetical protein